VSRGSVTLTIDTAEALDSPFLLLPFRLDSDPTPARAFIAKFFKSNVTGLTESHVLCSVLKWCWSRLPGGVVSWPVYEAFKIGETESNQARHAFETFIPIATASDARKNIVVDFFDLMAAVAAHGKMNGMGGRKVSRMAGWWAFDLSDDGKGFEGGYKSWAAAADATSHLFFAYLRSLSGETDPSLTVIERIPRSLQSLLNQTEYPPETPTLLQRTTPRVLMLVDTVSPGPFALLRRAKHFEYQQNHRALQDFSEFDDPLDALTDECRRVLYAIATTNSSAPVQSRHAKLHNPEESWSAFSNLGFADLSADSASAPATSGSARPFDNMQAGPRSSHNNSNGRPTTPSWADFLNSGFEDNGSPKQNPPTLFVPPGNLLPPIGSRAQTPATSKGDNDLAPGELAAIASTELDDAFWWVWMTSLSGEEPNERKAVFGRCALIETSINNGQWFIIEEQLKGASPEPMEGVHIVEKKSRFGFTKRGRNKNTKLPMSPPPVPQLERAVSATPSKHSVAPDQHAKIKAAAVALAQKENGQLDANSRRGRLAADSSSKTNSAMTLGLQSAAGPAMKWANSYDKKAVRAQYLGEDFTAKGANGEDLSRQTSYMSRVSAAPSSNAAPPALSPASAMFPSDNMQERELPALPKEEPSAPVEEVRRQEPAMPAPKAAEPVITPVESQQQTPAAESIPASEPTVRPSTDFFSPSISPAQSTKVERKPLPKPKNLEIHPAFREKSTETTRASPSPNRGPAVLAAQRALESKVNSSPDVKDKKQPANGAFKKMFARNKPQRNSVDLQQQQAAMSPPSESSLTRRFSHMRRKPSSPTVAQKAAETAANVPVAHKPMPQATSAQEPPDHEPVSPAPAIQHHELLFPAQSREPVSPMSPMSPVSDMTRVNSHENRVATTEFSRFDQGPMDDMPAAMPRDSIDDDANDAPDSPVKTHFDQRDHAQLSAHRDQQTPNEGFVTPLERRDVHPDAASIVSEDERDHEPDQQQQIQDRWAQIRENAQRRAAARVSEEQSRPSQSARTDDDGATSEEESKFWFLRASSITRVLTKSSQPSNHAWLVSKPVLPSLLATWTIPLSRVAEIHPITHASSLADANSPNDRT
jgi:hypothetical protein